MSVQGASNCSTINDSYTACQWLLWIGIIIAVPARGGIWFKSRNGQGLAARLAQPRPAQPAQHGSYSKEDQAAGSAQYNAFGPRKEI